MLNLDTIFADPEQARERQFTKLTVVESAPQGPECLPIDWYLEWDEQAAVMEYDGGVPREHAEAMALTEVLRQIKASSS